MTVVVVDMGPKGRGVIASRHFEAGDVIFEEPAWIRIDKHDINNGEQLPQGGHLADYLTHEHIAKAIQRLDQDRLDKFRANVSLDASDLSRFLCTFYEICSGFGQHPEALGYFSIGSYVNHSCRPNSLEVWDDTSQTLKFIALTKIPKGSEIAVHYLWSDAWSTTAQRRSELRRLYGFDCGCERCFMTDATAEAELLSLQRLLSAYILNTFQQNGNGTIRQNTEEDDAAAVITVTRFCSLVEAQLGGIDPISERPVFVNPQLSFAYRLRSEILQRNGQAHLATTLRSKARQVDSTCFGGITSYIVSQERSLSRDLLTFATTYRKAST